MQPLSPLEILLTQLHDELEEFKLSAKLQISWYEGRIYQLEQLIAAQNILNENIENGGEMPPVAET